MKHLLSSLFFAAAGSLSLLAAPQATIRVDTQKPGAQINPAMWGLFFEDINFGADGGLYAELVKNGSFEFPDPRMGWKRLGSPAPTERILFLARTDATKANTRLAEIKASPGAEYGLSNEGFRGIGIKAGDAYEFSVEARLVSGKASLRVELLGSKGILVRADCPELGGNWSKITFGVVATETDSKASLQLIATGDGVIQIDKISLFPAKTWKNRPQGLRADMVQILADMKPGFLRFPGGCIVEGFNLDLRYQWKKTIGPREERELLLNRWNVEMKDRQAPDYYQSFGLGFFEYFQLCEDIGAAPLPIINCGMACQYNSTELAPLSQLEPYIQDALDLIEFANGPVDSPWGAKRAAMGHPAPFHLRLLGVGNEQWGPQYVERYDAFAKVLKAKHPEVELVVAAGPAPADERFHHLWSEWKKRGVDHVDEHSYSAPSWFIDGFRRYDGYDRKGPKVFVGEYACHTKDRKNNLEAALAEAVFMLGLERNADVVRMASYAPLFAHVDAWQWKPDLIWVDSLRVIATPSYHVQKLFATNRGDLVVPVTVQSSGEQRLFASAAFDKAAKQWIIKVVNPEGQSVEAGLDLGIPVSGPVQRITLSAHSPEVENTPADPQQVEPRQSVDAQFQPTQIFAPYSLTVLRISAP